MYLKTQVVKNLFITNWAFCVWRDLEYWDEEDSDLDADFSTTTNTSEPLTPEWCDASEEILNPDEQAVVWWVVAFTCVFQTLHSLSSRAIIWLLQFLGTLFVVFGRYSKVVAKIAHVFPSTLYKRNQYLKEKLVLPCVHQFVVCPTCFSLYNYEQCLTKRGTRLLIKICSECELSRKHVPLLKEVITSTGSTKYYPYLVYPYTSLISSLQSLFSRLGFYHHCEQWRQDCLQGMSSSVLSDVYDGKIWKDFLQFQGNSFLEAKNSIAFMLNIDWFQPFKHHVYSIGVMYLAIMNLPRVIRFKRENIIIVGLIPGPSEPSKNINTYFNPLVSELCALWEGVSFDTHDSGTQMVHCALLCIGCDLPAGRKVCGFLSYTANLGCSRCYCNFGTGVFGKQNYSGFDRAKWILRTNQKHRDDVEITLTCSSKSARKHKESELGCRYSSLLKLSYFDTVWMLTIDPMHNLYLGTASVTQCANVPIPKMNTRHHANHALSRTCETKNTCDTTYTSRSLCSTIIP